MKTITNDRDWLDLEIEEEAKVIGTVDAHYSGNFLIVHFSDWSQLSIDVDEDSKVAFMVGEKIEIVVTRTEDGVFATADAVADSVVAHGTI